MDERLFDVLVRFDLYGLCGAQRYLINAQDERMANARAWAELEREMIDEGLPTHECGCCIRPACAGGEGTYVDFETVEL